MIDLGAYTAIGTVRADGATDHLIGVDTIIDGYTNADDDVDFSITLRGAHNLSASSFDL